MAKINSNGAPSGRAAAWLHARSATCVMVLLAACTPSELPTGSEHPANPAAASEPLPPIAGALASDFDPQNAGPGSMSSPDEHSAHQHGAGPAPHREPAASEGAHAVPGAAERANPGNANGPAGSEPDSIQWTCSMHPQVRQSKPGNCPICGMKLKPVAPKDGHGGAH
ncbi:MAG: heavy metal-binding domain-containing protein [Deltaproteobacteria bacterium]